MSRLRTACPTCRRSVEWGPDFPWRPFCSERCRLVDLGAWLSGERKIASEEAPGGEPTEAASPPDERRDQT